MKTKAVGRQAETGEAKTARNKITGRRNFNWHLKGGRRRRAQDRMAPKTAFKPPENRDFRPILADAHGRAWRPTMELSKINELAICGRAYRLP
ncbi:MAG: hypothetical protein E5V89_11545 [Mesorhizobium sp.]|nr:MAG: hypothetical protein E5V89_11545 [Mesorhizobium sp.]